MHRALGIHLPAAAIVHRPAHGADKEEQYKLLPQRRTQGFPVAGKKPLVWEQPLVYRLTGACRVVLYPVGQTKTITLFLSRQQAEELADILLPVTAPLWHGNAAPMWPGSGAGRRAAAPGRLR